MTTIQNKAGDIVARIEGEQIVLAPGSPDADMLGNWIASGVPALRGVKKGGLIVEVETLVQQSDPRYWMAFAEALEEHGLMLVES